MLKAFIDQEKHRTVHKPHVTDAYSCLQIINISNVQTWQYVYVSNALIVL